MCDLGTSSLTLSHSTFVAKAGVTPKEISGLGEQNSRTFPVVTFKNTVKPCGHFQELEKVLPCMLLLLFLLA